MEVVFTPGMFFTAFAFIVLFIVARAMIGSIDSSRLYNINNDLNGHRSYYHSDGARKALEAKRDRTGRFALLRSVPLFIVGVFILQAASFGLSSLFNTSPQHVTPAMAAERLFGMEHGETIPLVIGDRIDGSTMSASVQGGIFSHSVDMMSVLETGFAVDYVHEGSHYPLVIPSSKTEYITDGVTPGNETITMELEINNHSGVGNTSDRLGELYPSCEAAWWNLLIACVPSNKEPEYVGAPNTLAEVLKGDGIWHVTVRITEENFDQLFGFPSK